jgi:hypothetical protein
VLTRPAHRQHIDGLAALLTRQVEKFLELNIWLGANLEGASLSLIESRNTKLYGEKLSPEQVLFGKRAAPESAGIFTSTLMKLAPPPESGNQYSAQQRSLGPSAALLGGMHQNILLTF